MSRPVLGLPTEHVEAAVAVEAFAAGLERGLAARDADVYDASFGGDVLWGSPYGATLQGFDELNAIHHRLMDVAAASPSRFEVVQVSAPAPGVAVAHIRRQALEDGAFSEMALYVLVRRDGRWWLAAAQNTPISAAS
jgi:uncharacterized protein (TIGR02246 family)